TNSGENDLGKILNVHYTFSGIFLFGAPLLGKLIIDYWGYKGLFITSAAFFVVLLIFLNSMRFKSAEFEGSREENRFNLREITRIRNFILFFSAFFFRFLPLSMFSIYLPLFLKTQKGFSLTEIAIYFAIVDILVVILQIPAGILVDKYDKRIFIFLDGFTDVVFALICVFCMDKYLLIIGAVLSQLFNIPGGTALSIMTRNLFPKDKLKQVISFSAVIKHFSFIIGPVLGGYFITNISYRPIFYLIIAGSLYYSFISLRFSDSELMR
ncbi:MAG: MFS transporter, partial [Candidatus Wallbacteria bacterium]|nr:MFS transporter [Candidatus Wallbacteria bacterium]